MKVDDALSMLRNHVSKHTTGKYQSSILSSAESLKQPIFTLLTAQKYLVRYLALEGEKRRQVEDLLKACHMILCEVQVRLDESKEEDKS